MSTREKTTEQLAIEGRVFAVAGMILSGISVACWTAVAILSFAGVQ